MMSTDREPLQAPAGAVAHETGNELIAALALDIPAAVAVVRSGDGRILYASTQLEAMLGFSPGALEGRPASALAAEGDQGPEVTTAPGCTWSGNVRSRRLDGTVVWCELRVIGRWHHRHGAVCVSVRRDATGARHAEEELERLGPSLAETTRLLERANGELTRSNADLSEFASVAAHDLKSPLQTIYGYAELLARSPALATDPDASECVSAIQKGAARLQGMVDDLLSYAKVGTSGRRQVLVDCGPLLADIRDSLAAPIAATGATVSWGELPAVLGEPPELAQLFQNLIGNALKFRRPDRRPILEVSAHPNQEGWSFVVADNGVGIDPRIRDQIFRVFQRTSAGTTEGSGIGLAICRRVVQGHGGRIWVEDNPGGGTRVCFTLPGPTVCWSPF